MTDGHCEDCGITPCSGSCAEINKIVDTSSVFLIYQLIEVEPDYRTFLDIPEFKSIYFTAKGGCQEWTEDATKAFRFSRYEDAESIIRVIGLHSDSKVIEHKFYEYHDNAIGETETPPAVGTGNISLHDLLTTHHKACEALEYLLQVKAHKDTVGRDDWYKLNQPLAWKEAERAVEFLKKGV